jgi:CheY-like chemotaxis protein
MDLSILRTLRQPPEHELVLLTSIGANTSAVLTETCPHVIVKPVRQVKLAEVLSRALRLRSQAVSAPDEAKVIPERVVQHRVLLVEDNPDNRKLAARVLEGAGAHVDTAENGEQAVAMAKARLYDLVVMDLMMPVMDGFQATRSIRANEVAPNRVPIVALTAHATEGFRDRCLEAGMDDYLSKPFKKDRFLAVVEQWADPRPIVLVADDAPENRLIVKRFLMLGGDCRLIFATNGQEALERFEGHDISLVLLDMEMPVLNGFETARELRRRFRGGDEVPVIAMTAHNDSEELKRCLEAGCTTVVQKPLERKVFASVVSKFLVPRAVSVEPVAPADDENREERPSEDGAVDIDPDIQDLVPKFLDNLRIHAEEISDLASSGDFEAVRRLGHNMKGTGKGYGFAVISSYGASLEQAANRQAGAEIERLARELADYLARVEWRVRS